MISRRLLRIKVVKALYAHMKSESDSLQASEKTLVASIDKTYDLYFQMLALVAEVARYAEQRQEAAKQKKLPTFEDLNPNRKFVDNAVVRLIAESDSVNDRLAARKLSWAQYPELIKSLYAQLEQSDYYKLMMVRQFRQTGRKLWPVVRCMPADAGTEVGRFLYGNLNLNKLFEGRQIRAIFATDFHFVPGLYIKNIVR